MSRMVLMGALAACVELLLSGKRKWPVSMDHESVKPASMRMSLIFERRVGKMALVTNRMNMVEKSNEKKVHRVSSDSHTNILHQQYG